MTEDSRVVLQEYDASDAARRSVRSCQESLVQRHTLSAVRVLVVLLSSLALAAEQFTGKVVGISEHGRLWHG